MNFQKKIKIIYWFFIAAYSGLFYCLFFITGPVLDDSRYPEETNTFYLMIGLAIFTTAFSIWLHRKVNRNDLIKQLKKVDEETEEPESPRLPKEAVEWSDEQILNYRIKEAAMIFYIFAWFANFMALGGFGAILPYVGRSTTDGVSFIATSFILMIVQRPKFEGKNKDIFYP
jgi:hypothetical protein